MLVRLNDLLKKHDALSSWLLILVAMVFYHGVLSCGFVSDDFEQILNNPFVKNPQMWRRIFLGRVWSFAGAVVQAKFYRPLHIFTYWLVCAGSRFKSLRVSFGPACPLRNYHLGCVSVRP